jgi:hypothetical protein
MKKKIVMILVICCLFIATMPTVDSGIIEDKSTNGWCNANPVQQADWTFIAYLDGDNDLFEFLARELNYMEMVGSTENVNIVVLLDGLSYEDTKRYYIIHDEDMGNISSEFEDLGELNMGDPDTLSDFVCWAIDNYPADNYYLTLNNHGQGWKGVCSDWTDDDYLTSEDLKTALSKIKNHLGKKLDILFFDACMMGMLELYYPIKEFFDFGISSEIIVSATKEYVYKLILEDLTQNPGLNSKTIAENTAEILYDAGKFFDVAVIDGSRLDDLVLKINLLAEILIEKLSEYSDSIKLVGQLTPMITGISYRTEDGNYYNLWQFDVYKFALNTKIIVNDIQIKNAADKVIQAFDSTIILTLCYFPPHIPHLRYGLSLLHMCWFDYENVPDDLPDLYLNLDFAQDTLWDELLMEFREELNYFACSASQTTLSSNSSSSSGSISL